MLSIQSLGRNSVRWLTIEAGDQKSKVTGVCVLCSVCLACQQLSNPWLYSHWSCDQSWPISDQQGAALWWAEASFSCEQSWWQDLYIPPTLGSNDPIWHIQNINFITFTNNQWTFPNNFINPQYAQTINYSTVHNNSSLHDMHKQSYHTQTVHISTFP